MLENGELNRFSSYQDLKLQTKKALLLYIIEYKINKAAYPFDFLSSSMSDEQGFSSPLEGHVLALGNVSKLDLNLGQSQHILNNGIHIVYG